MSATTRVQYLDRNLGRQATHYDAIVEAWNRLKPWERRDRANDCAKNGHDWRPLSWGPHVCVRCLRYDMEGV